MIQPDVGHVYVAKGCITSVPAQPIRAKTKGLLERYEKLCTIFIDEININEIQKRKSISLYIRLVAYIDHPVCLKCFKYFKLFIMSRT